MLSLFGIEFNLLLTKHQKFLALLGGHVHHQLIEAVDRRILFPIQRVIDCQLLLHVAFLCHFFLQFLLLTDYPFLLPLLLRFLGFGLGLWLLLNGHSPEIKE